SRRRGSGSCERHRGPPHRCRAGHGARSLRRRLWQAWQSRAGRRRAADVPADVSGPMSAFAYRDGVLSADGVPLDWVASSVGSPVYCYSGGAITTAYRAFEAAFDSRPETRGRTTICYAVKANGNLSVVSTLAALGA